MTTDNATRQSFFTTPFHGTDATNDNATIRYSCVRASRLIVVCRIERRVVLSSVVSNVASCVESHGLITRDIHFGTNRIPMNKLLPTFSVHTDMKIFMNVRQSDLIESPYC